MLISHTHKFIYFGPPRTGSTSLCSVFKSQFDGEYHYRPELDPRPERFMTATGRAQHQICLPTEWRDYLTILSVRNPYTRFLSLFALFGHRHGCKTPADYYAKVEPPVCDELDATYAGCVPTRVDKIIRLETIQEDFNALPFVGPEVIIPHEAESRDFVTMTPDIRDFVNETYARDFERFEYQPE